MPVCNCRDLGWWGNGHDAECAIALNREANRIEKKRIKTVKKVKAMSAEIRTLRAALRKAQSGLDSAARYFDKEDSPGTVRSVESALRAVNCALESTKRGA